MRIRNAVHRLARRRGRPWLELLAASFARECEGGAYPLRSAIVEVDDREAFVESTLLEFAPGDCFRERFASIELLAPRPKRLQADPFAVVQIVPTGVRCEIGGFAGDATPATNLLAAAADVLIAHPNAVNASDLNEMARNVLYVEGKSLDDFLLGHLALLPVRANRIGTFVDRTGIAYLDDVLHALNAARAVAGIDCGRYVVADDEIGVATEWSPAGCAVGTVRAPQAILEVVERLLTEGADAIGGVSVIHGVTAQEFSLHLGGRIPNPSGGVEAIVTHLVSKAFRVPTAHAPLPYYQDIKERGTHNPRASAEFISTPHYFSVLKGLAKAPRLVPIDGLDAVPPAMLSVNNVGAIVAPATALGGIPALCAELSEIPLIAVEENATMLDVSNARMGFRNVVPVRSYLEAAGVVLALRGGISLESLRRPIGAAQRLEPAPAPAAAFGD